MAKDSDKKAAALKAEKTGALSGLLADEKEFDRRALWRIGWWGTAALGTVIVAVLANQGAQSWQRDRISAAELARQTQALQSLARDSQNQTRQLTAAIETLNNDRDRLFARVTVLEQGLDSMTGALAKQQGLAQAAGKPQTPAGQAAPQPATADARGPSQPSQAAATSGSGPSATSSNSPPAVAAVATTNAWGEKTRADSGKPGGTPSAASAWSQPSSATLSAMAAAPNPSTSVGSLVASKSIMAPPDPAASKLTETDKAAKADATLDSKPEPTREDSADSKPDAAPQLEANAGASASGDTTLAPAQKTEFAVDLGGANTVNGLRALWRGLSKTNSDLAALSPIIMVKEGSAGQGMQLRLGAGPLGDAAAAAKICANLAGRQRPCETTVYDGQRLAARENEVGPEAGKSTASGQKPAAANNAATATPPAPPQRRRVWQHERHGAVHEVPPAPPPAAAAPPPEPPKPEPNTLSSLFHRQQPPQ